MCRQEFCALLSQQFKTRSDRRVIGSVNNDLLTFNLTSGTFTDDVFQSVQIGIGVQNDGVLNRLVG